MDRLRRWAANADLRITAPLVFVAYLAILPGLGWGIPHVNHPDRLHGWGNDDQVPMATLAEMHDSLFGSPPNRNYAYPLGQHLVWAAFYAPVMAAVYATGGIESPSGEFPFGLEDPVGTVRLLSWVGRGVNATMAVIAILALYAAGRCMGSRAGGAVSAVGLLLTFPFLYYARAGNPDAGVLMWTCVGLAATAWILRDGYKRLPGCLLGAAIAAASGTKEQSLGSFFLVVPVLLSIALLARSERPLRERVVDILWSGAVFAGVFVLWHGIWLDPERFLKHLELLVAAGSGSVGGPGYLRHPGGLAGQWQQTVDLFFHLSDAMTWAWLAVSAAGIAFVARTRPRFLVLGLSAVGFFYMLLLVGFSRIHYVLALAAVLYLFAGQLAGHFIDQSRWSTAALAVVAALLVVPTLRAIDLTHDMRNDSRHAATEWLADRMVAGERAAYFGAALKLPHLPDGVGLVQVEYAADAAPTLERERPEWLLLGPEDTDEYRQRVQWREGPLSIHSPYLPHDEYLRLAREGSGYRLVAQFQSPRLLPWLPRPFLTYATVNPPVQIFVREDLALGLPALTPWKTAPHYPKPGRLNEPWPLALRGQES